MNDFHIFRDTEEALRIARRYFEIQWEYWEERDCETADTKFSLVLIRRLPIITVN